MRLTCIFENDGEKSFKNWLENQFCILPPLYGLEDKRFTSHMQRDFLFWRIQQPKVVNYDDYFGQCALRAQAD